MKKIILVSCLILYSFTTLAQNLPEKYVHDVEAISNRYSNDMRHFLRSLPNSTVQFNMQQKNQYCSIVTIYIDDFYNFINQNRASLPFSYANMNKHDVIARVKSSNEMQLLRKYNIECDLN